MKVIHRAGVVFLVQNVYFKSPIIGAVILCDGKQFPCVRKNDGYYVFVDMPAREYDIEIFKSGYVTVTMHIKLQENQTQVIPVYMSYTVDNPDLYQSSYFDIKLYHLGKPVANEEVVIKLNNELDFLNLVEPIMVGNSNIKLNIQDMLSSILGQNYIYKIKNKEFKMYLNEYNSQNKCYVMNDIFDVQVDGGGKFYVYWNLKSDSSGRVVLPFMGQFINNNDIEFSVICSLYKGKIHIDLTNLSGNSISVVPKLRKYTQKRKEGFCK